VVVRHLAKVEARVRFSYPAPFFFRIPAPTFNPSGSIRCVVLESCPLKPMLAYLCGPMDFSQQSPTLWRRKLAPFLRDQLGHRVCDPAEDARKVLTEEEIASFRVWQRTDLDRFRRAVRKLIAFDIELLENRADYVVCYWDSETAWSGATPAGLTAAYRKGIPVYLVTALPVEEVDAWMLGCSDQVFSSIESLKEFLAARFSREKQTQLWKD
jgi:hypothetical protein